MHPNETFLLKNVSYNFIIDHGVFLFFREDGTAVVFSVDPLGCTSQNGNICFISEAFESISEAKFDQKSPIQPIYNGLTWESKAKHLEKLEDGSKTLLHKVCHAACGKEYTEILLRSSGDISNLKSQYGCGWTPLHYTCRFNAQEIAAFSGC